MHNKTKIIKNFSLVILFSFFLPFFLKRRKKSVPIKNSFFTSLCSLSIVFDGILVFVLFGIKANQSSNSSETIFLSQTFDFFFLFVSHSCLCVKLIETVWSSIDRKSGVSQDVVASRRDKDTSVGVSNRNSICSDEDFDRTWEMK